MLTGGINGFYRFIHQLMKNLRIFINYMTIPLEKAGRSPALLEAARVHQKILSKLRAASRNPELTLCLVGMLL